jgi:competence protein ComEC
VTVDLRLAIPAACGWVAAAVVIGMPRAAIPALVVAWLLAGAALLWRRSAIVALAALAVALCLTSVALQSSTRQPGALVAAATAGRSVDVTGTTTATIPPGRGPFAVTLHEVRVGDVAVGGSMPVLVFGEHPESRVGIGATIALSGRLTVAEPGDDVAFLLFAEAPPEVIEPPPGLFDWANELRARFLAGATALPADGGALLAGLAIGDTSAVGDDLDTAMKTSSLSHLTAVSGANCAIVIGLIMTAGAALRLPRAARIAGSVAVLLAFVVLVTPEPSVLRAAIMAALVLAALWGGRPMRGLPVLALATIALLVADPWLARNYGFVLSVLATGGLLLLAGPLARALGRWLPRWLAVVIAVPVAAQLACQPVIILLDASIPTFGVAANLLAAPAAPLATVVGLAACVTLATPLGSVLLPVAWLPSAWIAAVARFFAAVPFARLPWPAGLPGVALLVALSAIVVAAVITRRRWLVLLLAVAVLGYGGTVAGTRIAELAGRPADWQIAACDIGQGDAVLVRSAGQLALIDTGPDPALLSGCLDDLGVGRIELVVLTHFDLDHIGGVAAIVGRADRVLVGPSDGAAADRMADELRAGGAAVEQVGRGPSGLLGDLRWQVLGPPQRLVGIEPGNQASVVVEFDPVGECATGCLSSVFLGDLGATAQLRLLAAVPLGPVDVVKVSHHGSSDQHEPLYERLHAVVGVIGVGADNDYGHPTRELLQLLERAGTTVERTDEHGLVLLSPGPEPGTVSVWTER